MGRDVARVRACGAINTCGKGLFPRPAKRSGAERSGERGASAESASRVRGVGGPGKTRWHREALPSLGTRHSASKTRVNALSARASLSPLTRGEGRASRALLIRGPLFSCPRLCAAQGNRSRATFDFDCRLNPGPGHFQQYLAVPFRLGLAGPTQTLLREVAEFLGRCRHGARLQAGAAVFLAKRQS